MSECDVAQRRQPVSEINYQALREAAERAIPAMERLLMLPADDDLLSEQELKDYGVDIDALNAFKFLTGPETVLALLDERERNQQYIKRRDQENEDIALTVGRLRVELEAAKKRIAELEAEPVSNSDELPLDYLQGHKDGLEWAAQLAEANHPQTGDWLYDDPIDLARAIRKGPDMPTVQAGNSPVTPDGWVMVPKEPTQAMIKAWLSEIANFRGHAAGYRAALEAAPQLEVNRG
ncbi:ead/Ea22-like family protein [Escherichia coli]